MFIIEKKTTTEKQRKKMPNKNSINQKQNMAQKETCLNSCPKPISTKLVRPKQTSISIHQQQSQALMRSKRKKITKISKLKRNITDILSHSSAHGLNRIFNTKRTLFKIMWLYFFVCSASCGIYMVTNSIMEYFKYEVVTQVKVVHEAPTQFPTVTFYNLKNHQEHFKLQDILLQCTFNSKNCDDSDFETKTDIAGNVYYQFNNGYNKNHEKVDIKNVMQSGKSYGLQIELFAGLPDPSIVPSGLHSTSNLDGFHVTVHNYSYDPMFNGGK
jgi:hypothetical protein